MCSNGSKGRLIESFYSALAGVTFEGRQSLLKDLYAGQQLILRRMPNNPYDSNAIAVYDSNSMQQVGFIRKYVAANLAPIMDRSDRCVTCTVKEITGGGDLTIGVNILIEIFEQSTICVNEYGKSGYNWNNNDLTKEDEWLRKAAFNDNKEAQYKLGVMYERGDYFEKDIKAAISWYVKAAEQGHEEAQNRLSVLREQLKDTDYYVYTFMGSRFIVGGSKRFDCSKCVYSYLDNYDASESCRFCQLYEDDDEAPDGFTKVSCAYCLKKQNCDYFWNRGGYGSLPICRRFIVDPLEC